MYIWLIEVVSAVASVKAVMVEDCGGGGGGSNMVEGSLSGDIVRHWGYGCLSI